MRQGRRTGKRPLFGNGGLNWSSTIFSEDEDIDELIDETAPRGSAFCFLVGSEDWVGTIEHPITSPTEVPSVYVGSMREGLPAISEELDLKSFGETAKEALDGPFSGSRTYCAFELLGEELWDGKSGATPRRDWQSLNEAERLANACAKQICAEVVADSRSGNYVHGPDIRGYLRHPQAHPGVIPIKRRMGINTNDKRNFDALPLDEKPSYSAYDQSREAIPIYLGHLSSGTEGTLLWIRWLALKLVHHYEFEQGWEKKPAILLIDEIENHLHPTWQRRVIPALLEHFPGLQIFATTHSPFVVAGLKAGQVHLLERDENGVVTATTHPEDIVGWTADEVLRNLMGVEDPTDDETAAAARELRELRNEGPLDDPDAEAERQERMLKLRQRVDRDLLEGGPWAAQRAQFEEQFAEALEKYRQSKDLGQENG